MHQVVPVELTPPRIRTYRIYLQKWNVRKYKQRSYHSAPNSRGVHQLPAQPPSEKPAETISGFDAHQRILPIPRFVFSPPSPPSPLSFPSQLSPRFGQRTQNEQSRIIPWIDTPDIFYPTAWPARSPSTVASEYVGSPAHNGHFMEPAVLPRSPSVASEYVGSPAHDGDFMKPAVAVPALSDGGYLAVPGQTKREQVRGEFACYYPSGGVWASQRY